MNKAISKPGKMLLSPGDHTLIMIDFQSQMAFATKSIDAVTLRNNAALVANAAKIFNVSVIPTTVAEKSFSGPMFDEIKAAFPRAKFFDRTSMNTWEDKAVIEEVNGSARAASFCPDCGRQYVSWVQRFRQSIRASRFM